MSQAQEPSNAPVRALAVPRGTAASVAIAAAGLRGCRPPVAILRTLSGHAAHLAAGRAP